MRAPIDTSSRNACLRDSRCFPLYHVIGAYHSFLEETLGSGLGAHGEQRDGLLSGHAMLHMQHRCLNELDGGSAFDRNGGGAAFLGDWGPSASSGGKLLVAECMTGMMWYPNLAGRYAREWTDAYWPCKADAIKKEGRTAFFRSLMWSRCRPRALAALDAAHGVGGVGREATPPFVLRMLYPASTAPKVIAVVRNPTERAETSYWLHPHYPSKYGATSAGLHEYMAVHVRLFAACEARFGTRRCAFFFENLDAEYTRGSFFAADQIIRGVYWPFLAEWRAAFGPAGLLVVRAEQLLDAPAIHRPRVLAFLGLPAQLPAESSVARGPPSYLAMHAATLRSYSAEPMLNATRALLDDFYAPHNRRLAELLGWAPDRIWPRSAPPPAESFAQGAAIRYRRYGPHFPSNQPTRYVGFTGGPEGAATSVRPGRGSLRSPSRSPRKRRLPHGHGHGRKGRTEDMHSV